MRSRDRKSRWMDGGRRSDYPKIVTEDWSDDDDVKVLENHKVNFI